jgi:response regulator RpfG family c-di-GMP phosphodiesterase
LIPGYFLKVFPRIPERTVFRWSQFQPGNAILSDDHLYAGWERMPQLYVLCVEDEPEVLDAIVKDLADIEDTFPIETARSVTEAREIVASIQQGDDRLALCLCDHIMPHGNGVEFLVDLLRDPFTMRTRKVLVSGQAGLEATIRAVNYARLDYYITKPWEKESLLGVARTQLKEYLVQEKMELGPYSSFFSQESPATPPPDSR